MPEPSVGLNAMVEVSSQGVRFWYISSLALPGLTAIELRNEGVQGIYSLASPGITGKLSLPASFTDCTAKK